MQLERSWLLPLLREGANGASLQFFKEKIVPLAMDCQQKWKEFTEAKNKSSSHIYELLCCQLWGLFPGFCRQPRDPEYLRQLAPGVALLSMGIKSVPAPVLRKRFAQTAATMQTLLQRFVEATNQSVIRYVSGWIRGLPMTVMSNQGNRWAIYF